MAQKVTPIQITNPYKFSAYNSGTISTGTTWQKLAMNTEEYDTGSNYDNATNYRFVAPVAGFYQFSACAEVSGQNGEVFLIALYKNGSNIKTGARTLATTTTAYALTVSPPPMLLAANDYIELFFYNGAAAARSISAGPTSSYFGGGLSTLT